MRMGDTISIGSRVERYFARRQKGGRKSTLSDAWLLFLASLSYKLRRRVNVAPISLTRANTPRSVARSFTVDQVETLIKIFSPGRERGGIIGE